MRRALTATIMTLLAMTSFTGCSKEPATATTQSEPNNAMTRWAQGLADDQRHAKVVEDKANQVIAQENDEVNQASKQMGNNQ